VVVGFLAFALINSSDMFLLLRLKQIGFSEQGVVGVYLFYNVVYAILSYPAGALGDRWGFGKTFTIGLVLFATVYGSLAFVNNTPIILGLFVLYGFDTDIEKC
jgi:MFS family permease